MLSVRKKNHINFSYIQQSLDSSPDLCNFKVCADSQLCSQNMKQGPQRGGLICKWMNSSVLISVASFQQL